MAETNHNHALKTVLSSGLIVLANATIWVNAAEQDSSFFAISAFLMALSFYISFSLLLRTEANQGGKMFHAFSMCVIEAFTLWQLIFTMDIIGTNAYVIILAAFGFIAHAMTAAALTFGNVSLEIK